MELRMRCGWSVAVFLAFAGCTSSGDDVVDECGPQQPCPAGFSCDAASLRCLLSSTDADAGCVPGSGPTMHGSTIGDETWSAELSPHVLPADTNVEGTLTLASCAVLQIAPRRIVTVKGALETEGTAGRPVTIGSTVPGTAFGHIRTLGGTLRLEHTTIEDGGDMLNTGADYAGALMMQGKGPTVPGQETLFVDHVTIRGSRSNGIVLYDAAGFAAGSDALTITGSGRYPVSTWARAAGGIPAGSYSGNARDEILLWAQGGGEGFTESTTLHNRGVPYHVGHDQGLGDLRVVAPLVGKVTLTIEPGVILRFKKGGVLHVDFTSAPEPARAALVAVGTEAAPIVFTSLEAAPAAGDWLGIYFWKIPDATSRLEHTRVEYAGGQSSSGSSSCAGSAWTDSDAAIRIFGPPASQFVTNTAILDSAGHGIDRGYRATTKTDFLPTNSFARVTNCLQSYAGDPTFCPAPDAVPCPR